MINNTEIARKKVTRGAVLDVLYTSQAAPMMVSTLELALMPGNANIGSEIVPTINYLSDRGYIRVTDRGDSDINPLRGMMVRITDKGQDVIEGTIRDEGVLFPRQ